MAVENSSKKFRRSKAFRENSGDLVSPVRQNENSCERLSWMGTNCVKTAGPSRGHRRPSWRALPCVGQFFQSSQCVWERLCATCVIDILAGGYLLSMPSHLILSPDGNMHAAWRQPWISSFHLLARSAVALSRRRPAERLHEKAFVFFLPFGTRATVRIFLPFCTCGTLRTDLDKTNLLKTPCLHPFSLCFFDVCHARFFGGSGHLPMLSHMGVAQILHMCSAVFEQHAVIPVEGSFPPETNAVNFFVLALN